jgi:hypothetical protein
MLVALNQAQTMQQQLEDNSRTDTESVAKPPDTWKLFAKALETYLGQLLGSGHIPLHYIIQHQAHYGPNTQFTNEQEQAIALAPLVGYASVYDNTKVYIIIKQLVLEGRGRSYILPFDSNADGRSAWLAVIDHFEGDGFRNCNVEDAYCMLEHLFVRIIT